MLTSPSTLFTAALRQSHTALTRAWLMNPLPAGGFEDIVALSVPSGRLHLDGTRNVWRSGDVGMAPTDPVDRSELALIDSTSRLRIERGIQFPDLTTQWVTIGLMQSQDPELTLTSAEVSVGVADLASLVEDYSLITPYVPQDMVGTPLTAVAAIQDLVAAAIVWDTIPGWDVGATIDTALVPTAGTVFTGGRWAAIQSLSQSLGAVTYAKPDGRWAIRSTTADIDNPVAEFSTGVNGTVVGLNIKRARSAQYNAVPLRWGTSTLGGLVFIVDADATSPTFWSGPFGRKPHDEIQNDLIATEADAIIAATALLDQYRGLTSSLSIEAVHNPLLEPMDVILVRNGSTVETHIVDTIDYPLTGGSMGLETRLLRVEA